MLKFQQNAVICIKNEKETKTKIEIEFLIKITIYLRQQKKILKNSMMIFSKNNSILVKMQKKTLQIEIIFQAKKIILRRIKQLYLLKKLSKKQKQFKIIQRGLQQNNKDTQGKPFFVAKEKKYHPFLLHFNTHHIQNLDFIYILEYKLSQFMFIFLQIFFERAIIKKQSQNLVISQKLRLNELE
ncbi:unnamed protein product [Paramecium primaurelia]|uniref:Uncharacterized protein n=1 Tax=Paramecium primaurelia TaxID=5886 RepID=A0A8S1PSK5_PARPR|nr:unnamed protein product [Paramecium primaurelia]